MQVSLLDAMDASPNTISYSPNASVLIGLVEPESENSMATSTPAVPDGWRVNDRIQGMVDRPVAVKFAPIDHNPDYEAIEPAGYRCDCLVYNSEEHIVVFVELKDRRDPEGKDIEAIAKLCVEANALSVVSKDDREEWLPKAVIQLQQTIERFKESDPVEFAVRKSLHAAYVSNRKKGYGIPYVCECLRASFKARTTFTLYVTTKISMFSPAGATVSKLMTDDMFREMTE